MHIFVVCCLHLTSVPSFCIAFMLRTHTRSIYHCWRFISFTCCPFRRLLIDLLAMISKWHAIVQLHIHAHTHTDRFFMETKQLALLMNKLFGYEALCGYARLHMYIYDSGGSEMELSLYDMHTSVRKRAPKQWMDDQHPVRARARSFNVTKTFGQGTTPRRGGKNRRTHTHAGTEAKWERKKDGRQATLKIDRTR